MKKHKTAAQNVIFILLLAISILYAQSDATQPKITITDGSGARVTYKIEPDKPNLGDIVKIICNLSTPYKDLSEPKTVFAIHQGGTIINGNTSQVLPLMKKGGATTFSIKLKITSRHLIVNIWTYHRISYNPADRNKWEFIGGKTIDLITLAENDTISYEKFGNDDELWPRIGPEYQYDIVGGFRIPPLGRVSDEAKNTRVEIEELKKQDPTLSDWDALEMLHDAFEEMVVRYDIHTKEVSIPILLRARVIMQKEGLKKWPAIDKAVEEYQNRNKEPKSQIFRNRPDNTDSIDIGSVPDKALVNITISGTIKYKKHIASIRNTLPAKLLV